MPNAQIMRDYQAAIIAVSEWYEARAPKQPRGMNLRELIEHAAEVNDALREALMTHPGLT